MDSVVSLYAAQPFWLWVALAAGLLAVEVVTGSGWLLWASAAAAATALATGLMGLSLPLEILVFAALTMASTLLARRYFPRSAAAHAGDINDNVARLVGRRAAAVAGFDRGAGRVFIDGKEWPAQLEGADSLEAGASVEVLGVEGSRLKVRRT